MRTGDEGQRYEVRAKDPGKIEEIIIGWSETLVGAESLSDGIMLHPAMHSPRIIDREHK